MGAVLAFVWMASVSVRAASDDPIQMIEKQIGLVKDGRTTRYVRAVGARLAEHAPTSTHLSFFVVDMQAPNAFALEGGQVFVSRGLLAILNSEDELANVMAHEVGHVVARHTSEKPTTENQTKRPIE